MRDGRARRGSAPALAVILVVATGGGVLGQEPVGSPVPTVRPGADFDADGFDDLVVGAPFDDLVGADGSALRDAGSVTVRYGRPGGPGWVLERWTQDGPGVAGSAEPGDRFGWSLAAGDLDDDGFDDLVVGVPGEDRGRDVADVGGVNVLFGSADGLRARSDQPFVTTWLREAGSEFGYAVAVFRTSEGPEVAIGGPGVGEPHGKRGPRFDIGGLLLAGTARDGRRGVRASTRYGFGASDGARAGSSIAVGNVDGDPEPELVLGAPGDRGRIGTGPLAPGAGAIVVMDFDTRPSRGGAPVVGLRHTPHWRPGRALPIPRTAGDRLGASVAMADLDGDGFDEVLVGVPGRDVAGVRDAGSVLVIPAAPDGSGLRPDAAWEVDRRSPGLHGLPAADARFGSVLLAADLVAGSPGDEVVFGIPDERVDGLRRAGRVLVGHGLAPEIVAWRAGGAVGLAGVAVHGARLGAAVAVGDYDGDGSLDLAIGAPGDAGGDGIVRYLAGSPAGPGLAGIERLADDPGPPLEPRDRGGWSLS